VVYIYLNIWFVKINKVINISSKTKLFTLTGEKYGISSITRRTSQRN